MSTSKAESLDIQLRVPEKADGAAVYDLIGRCPPLDTNSMYCNLLQCSHFANTSVAAELAGEVVGFVSGYLIPGRPQTLFIWQVAVGEKARGQGLATKMLQAILARNSEITQLETTITEDNEASWALFRRLADKLDAKLDSEVMFDRHKHFADRHNTEMLVKIGPFGL